jgi:hypothetical protein
LDDFWQYNCTFGFPRTFIENLPVHKAHGCHHGKKSREHFEKSVIFSKIMI